MEEKVAIGHSSARRGSAGVCPALPCPALPLLLRLALCSFRGKYEQEMASKRQECH
ncbi:MAG TPA: hypothetical protein VKV20_16120 [Ktedonobacteraceae bacterium]|nr:hypothetical protein [Ktedonobacteraceae bacterium]